jgi:hypothetical protein
MEMDPYGRQAAAFKVAFEAKKEDTKLQWLNGTSMYFLYKKEIRLRHSTTDGPDAVAITITPALGGGHQQTY